MGRNGTTDAIASCTPGGLPANRPLCRHPGICQQLTGRGFALSAAWKIDPRQAAVYIERMHKPHPVASSQRAMLGFIVGLLFSVGLSQALAQEGPPRMPQFEADAPKIGEELPDLTIHDSLGNPVNLRELSDENYKVLVLGCLT